MPSFDEVKKMIQGAQTDQDRADAARALSEHIPADQQNKQILMTKRGINTLRLGDLPNTMQHPSVFEQIKKIFSTFPPGR